MFILQCVYQCQCRAHGSVHPGLVLCPLRFGSAFFCLVLSVVEPAFDAGVGPDGTSQDENVRTAEPHQETPLSWRSHPRSFYWHTVRDGVTEIE